MEALMNFLRQKFPKDQAAAMVSSKGNLEPTPTPEGEDPNDNRYKKGTLSIGQAFKKPALQRMFSND